MPEISDRIKYLFQRFIEKSCTKEELQELYKELNDTNDQGIYSLMDAHYENLKAGPGAEQVDWEHMFQTILSETKIVHLHKSIDRGPSSRFRMTKKIAVAASVILMLGLGTYFLFFNNTGKKDEVVQTAIPHDVEAPKGTKAMITLTDGRIIPIDSLTTIDQANVQVRKTVDGQIVYSGIGKEVVFNTISNPRGSKVIDLVLNDGSHVWLNAGSSLTYPVGFIGNDRNVSITGEAYFEVARDSRPFSVRKGDMVVQVLGTKFNVNAYDDESNSKVTLLEGSVKVSKGNSHDFLKPGQQARIFNEVKVVNGVNVEEVMAWKNGTFYFNNTNIETIMRQAARWYDVEVRYEGNVRNEFFGGTVPRTENISQLIKALELTKTIKIIVEGKKIIIRPAK